MTNPLFTPLFDHILKEHGLWAAAVYGRIWRYCQMSDHVCRASLDVLANQLGIDRKTVLKNITILEDARLIFDYTPDRRNSPHIYILARAGEMPRNISTSIGKDPETGGEPGDSGIPAGDTGSGSDPQPGVPESHLNQTLLRDKEEEEKKRDSLFSPPQETEDPQEPVLSPDGKTYTAQKLWGYIAGELYERLVQADFHTWVKPCRPLAWDGITLRIGLANRHGCEWLRDRVQISAQRLLQGKVASAEARLTFEVQI